MGVQDFYLDRANLEGQPKKTIGDYIETEGLLVPRRFAALKDARQSHLPIIGRFEHPQDYAGASNIGPGVSINCPSGSEDKRFFYVAELEGGSYHSSDELVAALLNPNYSDGTLWHCCSDLHFYCRAMSIEDHDGFINQSSFSFWEFIPGVNLAVVADSAVNGRYHVIMQHRAGVGFINYAVIEPDNNLRLPLAFDKFIFKGNHPYASEFIPNTKVFGNLKPRLERIVRKAVENYKAVHALERFDENHAHIIEMQADEGENVYILQVHRTRDMEFSDFSLDVPSEDGWIEALEVRGITKTKGGEQLRLTYWGDKIDNLPEEEASCYHTLSPLFDELMSRRRQLEILAPGKSWLEVLVAHGGRSSYFKPRFSIVLDYNQLLTDEEKEIREDGASIDIQVKADGNRAFVRRINYLSFP